MLPIRNSRMTSAAPTGRTTLPMIGGAASARTVSSLLRENPDMSPVIVRNNMAPLSERQQTAEALMHELHRLGAFVINPMPLRPEDKLRFQVLMPAVESVLAKLAEWNWSPVLQSHGLRFTPQGAKSCITYEIHIPADRPEVKAALEKLRGRSLYPIASVAL